MLSFSDATAIALATEDPKPHLIINVYNSCDKSIISELHEYLRSHINVCNYGIIIVEGDFNTHHSIWNPAEYTRHDDVADALVKMMMKLELTLLLSSEIVTYLNADITIDLI